MVGESSIHELISVISELITNLMLMILLIWMYWTGRLQRIWNDITEFTVFGASIKKRSAQEATELDPVDGLIEGDEETIDPVIWATSGRRPAETIAALIEKGYAIREIDPLLLDNNIDIANIISSNKYQVIVTNLKHGDSFKGGENFSRSVREINPQAKIVIFTSESAKNRRRNHIRTEIKTQHIATNEPELEYILSTLLR